MTSDNSNRKEETPNSSLDMNNRGPIYKMKSIIELDPLMLSRGTDKFIKTDDAITLDYMPRFLGNCFMQIDELREDIYNYGKHSLCDSRHLKSAYKELAEKELKRGSLIGALEAYKRSLVYNTSVVKFAVRLASGTSIYGCPVVFNLKKISDLEKDLESSLEGLGELEETLAKHIIAKLDLEFDPKTYEDFVDRTRQLKRDFKDVKQNEELTKKERHRQLLDLYVEMRLYHEARKMALNVDKDCGDEDCGEEIRVSELYLQYKLARDGCGAIRDWSRTRKEEERWNWIKNRLWETGRV